MAESIFTGFSPTIVGRATWYTVRPLTMEDVQFSDWRFSEGAKPESVVSLLGVNGTPYAQCYAKFPVDTLILLPGMQKEIVAEFFRRFEREVISAVFRGDVSYVGIRWKEQWRKYNTALAEVKFQHQLHAEFKRQEALANLNEQIRVFVDSAQREYVRDAISWYRKIDSYDGDVLDESAGNTDLNKQINELSKQIAALKEQRDANRQQALRNYWESENPARDLPTEVVTAIKANVKVCGFIKPNGFISRD